MKNLILIALITVLILGACRNRTSSDTRKSASSSQGMSQPANIKDESTSQVSGSIAINTIIEPYLQMKNALAQDNSSDAASAGKILENSIKSFDKKGLSSEQMTIFEDAGTDAMEHAKHIGESGSNIEHLREHFEMLSKDIYDLVKSFGTAGQVLYKDFCPMYNDGQGAFWLSEKKEIQNPYYGSKMPACGSIKEELR